MNSRFTLHHGDNREVLKTFEDNSVDSIVCDPPYELGFMGKKWDSTGIAYDVSLWAECLRVLKPGGHLIAFGGTRTYHRMTCAIEDAGFEIRDSVIWMYGSGFPKSHNVSKAIDATIQLGGSNSRKLRQTEQDTGGESYKLKGRNNGILGEERTYDRKEWSPATPEAQQWHGWGTALKPAHEPAVLARKPLTGTVADNVLTWGVGALNIDGCRVEYDGKAPTGSGSDNNLIYGHRKGNGGNETSPLGRWPANVILDEHAAEALDEQSGYSKSKAPSPNVPYGAKDKVENDNSIYRRGLGTKYPGVAPYNDSGGASRFFYIAKASRAEREAGLEGMEVRVIAERDKDGNLLASEWRSDPRSPNGGYENKPTAPRANHHPTVKPIALMRHLVCLVTPKGGTVLDPFMGSGSTGCAAMMEGMRFVGIDITAEYVDIAERRIQYWMNQNPMEL